MVKRPHFSGNRTLSQLQEASRRHNQDIREALAELDEEKEDKPAPKSAARKPDNP